MTVRTKWTEEQKQFLRDNWDVICRYEIAEAVDKSPMAVSSQARRFGLPPSKVRRHSKQASKPTPKTEPRNCIYPGCGKEFQSAGPHNRMCNKCRRELSTSPFELERSVRL